VIITNVNVCEMEYAAGNYVSNIIMAFTMQCNSEKFQPGQIEILTENREGINATSVLQWLSY